MERGGSEYYKTSYPRALAIRTLLMKEIKRRQKRPMKNGAMDATHRRAMLCVE
jgi:hypothetical protein